MQTQLTPEAKKIINSQLYPLEYTQEMKDSYEAGMCDTLASPELLQAQGLKVVIGEWQICPKCNGEGKVSNSGMSTSLFSQCNLCNGAMVIQKPILPQPPINK